MKKKSVIKIVVLMFFIVSNFFAQGEYAAEFKEILGTRYYTEKDIPQLNNYKYFGGSIISDLVTTDSFYLALEVFRKGTTAIVIMSKLIDKETKQRNIIEVLKINNVPQSYEIRIVGCTLKNMDPDNKIVAVYYIGRKKNVKLIKESYILKDIRFKKINSKSIKCINEI